MWSTTCPAYRVDHMPYGGVRSGLGRGACASRWRTYESGKVIRGYGVQQGQAQRQSAVVVFSGVPLQNQRPSALCGLREQILPLSQQQLAAHTAAGLERW